MRLSVLLALTTAAYWPLAWVLGDGHHQALYMLLDSICIIFAVAMVVAITPALRDGLRQTPQTVTHAHMLSIGILFAGLTALIRMGWVWLWRLHGEPAGMLDHPIFGWGLWTFGISVICFLLAYRFDDGSSAFIPPFYYRIGILSALAAGLAMLAYMGVHGFG